MKSIKILFVFFSLVIASSAFAEKRKIACGKLEISQDAKEVKRGPHATAPAKAKSSQESVK